MKRLRTFLLLVSIALLTLSLSACGGEEAPPSDGTLEDVSADEFIYGVILVGPQDDHGWSEAHFNGASFLEAHLPNSRMIFIDNLNPEARPDTTLEMAIDTMVAQDVQLVFITSDDFSVDTPLVAEKYPDVTFIQISGDHVLQGDAPSNLGNYMAQMIYGKMMAGCAAALATQTGSIGYVGPLVNAETTRLANAAYLGARFCYENYRQLNPDDLTFTVDWIGYWFHIPEVTDDPTVVANRMIDNGADVLISGIDTTEALAVTVERRVAGEAVWAVPYDYEGACEQGPEACLGVPYFNWGTAYLEIAEQVQAGTWTSTWIWDPPYWEDINDAEISPIGFSKGSAMNNVQSAYLDQFMVAMANGFIDLFKGPLNYSDGSVFLTSGELASEEQIWYMSALLEGIQEVSD